MPTNEYMTTEIEQVIPMLDQTCDDLVKQVLVRSLTQKTKEWVAGDPELADILLEGSKTLEECVRFVTEKAALVISKNINAMKAADVKKLPKVKIQGMDATMAGGAIDDEQVYAWAQEYYYNPDAKPKDFVAEAERKRKADEAKREAERKKADANNKKKTAGKKGAAKVATSEKAATGSSQSGSSTETDTAKDDAEGFGEQMSMFEPPPGADAAAA